MAKLKRTRLHRKPEPADTFEPEPRVMRTRVGIGDVDDAEADDGNSFNPSRSIRRRGAEDEVNGTQPPVRDGLGYFLPGNKVRTAGRPTGATNKLGRVLREAILLAAQNHGRDGSGKNGLTGYLEMLAATERPAFAGLLRKLLPSVIRADGSIAVSVLAAIRAPGGHIASSHLNGHHGPPSIEHQREREDD